MPPEGIEIVQRLRWRENSGFMEFAKTKEVSRWSPQELKFVCYILRLEDLTKSVKWWAYVMSGGVPMRLHAQYLSPKVKKSYSWETASVSKEEVVYLHLKFTHTESHEANIMVESPSEWTSTTPVIETSESIEPKDTNLEVNAIGYTFSKIF